MKDLSTLIEGYRRFRQNGWSEERARWSELAEGQDPKVMVIACSDSRVDPSQIFDAHPGEMFVVRNVGALVPPFETDPSHHGVSSALEFAVTQLAVEDIVIMGHGLCGGCAASLTGRFDDVGEGEGLFIARWIDLLRPAREKVRREHPDMDDRAFRMMEQEAVRISLKNLRTFPFISEREAAGRLKLHGSVFAITDGILHLLDPETDTFQAC